MIHFHAKRIDCKYAKDLFYFQGRGQPRYDHIRDPVSGGINAQVVHPTLKRSIV